MTEMETTEISVAYPEAPDLQLRITVGACRLTVAPGDGEEWVSGSYQAPSGALPVKVQQEGGNLRITQEYRLAGIGGVLSRVPRLDLKLGKANPYGLSLETGATESTSDLGGLPVTRMVVKQGAGKIYFDFSAPNPQSMSLLDLDAGAVNLEMRNLANANFAEMRVDGGAAAYKFDFGGNLQRGPRPGPGRRWLHEEGGGVVDAGSRGGQEPVADRPRQRVPRPVDRPGDLDGPSCCGAMQAHRNGTPMLASSGYVAAVEWVSSAQPRNSI
jgi:hypothetical protein